MLTVVAAGPPRVAAPGFIRENVTPATEKLVNEQLAVDFARQGVEVMTSAQVQAALDAQKLGDLAGCEAGSCVLEIRTVLGVDALLLGSMAKLGEAIQLDAAW